MRGVSDEDGRSPFWEGLGRHFFSIDYDRAEHIVGMGNKSCIAELMPKHPIYTMLLSDEARAVIGNVHPQTRPALHLLEQEGFRYHGYIDIFDGGPTVETSRTDIRSVRESTLFRSRIGLPTGATQTWLVANTRLADYRCLLASLAPIDGELALTPEMAAALGIDVGAPVRAVAL
jgi:arginine N-succinyltransferase